MKTSKRLVKTIKPSRYQLDFDIDMVGFSYQLGETIEFELLRATTILELHCKGPKVTSAKLKTGAVVMQVSYDKVEEAVLLEFETELKAGNYTLELELTGEINDSLHGFYRSRYIHNGQERYLATTQFEATHARECFASIDEPAAKAVFEVSMEIPGDLAVVSNTPIAKSTDIEGSQRHQFEPTPIMSTYLLAFVIGDLESIETESAGGVKVRVYTTPGKSSQGQFALDAAAKILDFYADYFAIPYPLAKLDMLAIPDFAAGAMENWGAVTYRESDLLIDEANSAQANRERVAMVVAHELAHQWFGNLVTMAWWTDLWLNEGFASWVEYLACDHLFPDWKFWEKFVAADYSRALDLDALANTHAIEIEVKNPSQISEIFDAISYSKGASILRMLHHYLGADKFRGGLQQYLKKFAYTNSTTANLWQALEDYSGQPVTQVMPAWTSRPGHPLVSFDASGQQITQRRFPSGQADELWPTPISALTDQGEIKRSALLETARADLDIKLAGWFKPNPGQTGFYVSAYTPEQIGLLKPQIPSLEAIDRWGILADCLKLTSRGLLLASSLLELLEAYRDDDNYIVWSLILGAVGDLRLLLDDGDLKAFDGFASWLSAPLAGRLGFEASPNEGNYTTLLRPLIMLSAGLSGNHEVITQAKSLLKQFFDTGELDPNLRPAVYRLGIKHGNADTYHQMMERYESTQLQEEARRMFYALASTQDEVLIKQTLETSLGPKVRSQDSISFIAYVLMNRRGRQLAWQFIQVNWPTLKQRYADSGHGLSYLPQYLGMAFADDKVATEIQTFFAKNATGDMERSVKQGVEQIRLQAEWKRRDHDAITGFVSQSRFQADQS